MKKTCVILSIAILLIFGFTVMASAAVPTPSAQLIPRTANSIPWGAADRQLVPINLSQYGYVEEEYFVSGTANVYKWDKSIAEIRTPNAPYTNNIIVRRPANPSKFSGNVIVEILNATNGWDVPVMWAQNWPKIFRDGDVYVGMSARPIVVQYLKLYNPTRYAPLSWANPLPESQRNSNPPTFITASDPASEDGLLWDIFSQTASLLKSKSPQNPLRNYRVERVYGTGASQSAMDLTTYINAVHPLAKLANGRPAYDGYLLFSGGTPAPINQDSLPVSDVGRMTIRNCSVPVIRVATEYDYNHAPGSLSINREDNDAIGDRFRLYEMAGVPHATYVNMLYRPGYAEMQAIGKVAKLPASNYNTMPVQYVTNAALINMDLWVRKGIVPPRAARIVTDSTGATVFDQYGNAKGEMRLPYLDVPIGAYKLGNYNATDGKYNPQLGTFTPLDATLLKQLYPNHGAYVSKFTQAVMALVAQRFILPGDGAIMIQEAARSSVPR